MKPFKATKKPVTIEAIQWEGTKESLLACLEFMTGESVDLAPEMYYSFHLMLEYYIKTGLEVKTLEGVMRASVNDYIIKGIKGEFYPCKPDIFHATYDVHNESEPQTMTELCDEIRGESEDGMILCQDENGDFHLYKPVKSIQNREGRSVDEILDELSCCK